jgi:hypothetical protein
MMQTHYMTLGVFPSSTLAEIRQAYRHLQLANHPDKTQNLPLAEREGREELSKQVNAAWEILSNGSARKKYDNSLGLNIPKPSPMDTETRQPTPQPSPQAPWRRAEPVYHRTSGWAFDLEISARWRCEHLGVDIDNTVYSTDRLVVTIRLEERPEVLRFGAGTHAGVDVDIVVAKTPEFQGVTEVWSEMVGRRVALKDLTQKADKTQRLQYTLTITVLAPLGTPRLPRRLAFGWDVFTGLEHQIPSAARRCSTLMTFHTTSPSKEARTPLARGSPAWTLMHERPDMAPVGIVDIGGLAVRAIRRNGETDVSKLAAVGYQKEKDDLTGQPLPSSRTPQSPFPSPSPSPSQPSHHKIEEKANKEDVKSDSQQANMTRKQQPRTPQKPPPNKKHDDPQTSTLQEPTMEKDQQQQSKYEQPTPRPHANVPQCNSIRAERLDMPSDGSKKDRDQLNTDKDVKIVVSETPSMKGVGAIWSEIVRQCDLKKDGQKGRGVVGEHKKGEQEQAKHHDHILTITIISAPTYVPLTHNLEFSWTLHTGLEHLVPSSARQRVTMLQFHTTQCRTQEQWLHEMLSTVSIMLRARPALVPVGFVDIGTEGWKWIRYGEGDRKIMQRLAEVRYQKEEQEKKEDDWGFGL